jgi:hypothetical protein
MDPSNLSITASQLVQNWYDISAKDDEPTTDERVNLYQNTINLAIQIERNPDDPKAKQTLDAFNRDNIKEMTGLARWIGTHTFKQGSTSQVDGAYPIFHRLYQALQKSKNLDKNLMTESQLKGLEQCDYIDFRAEQQMKVGKGNLSQLDEKSVQLTDELSLENLAALRSSSKQNRSLANRKLAKKINSEEVTFRQLNIRTFKELLAFFGSECKELLSLRLFMDWDSPVSNYLRTDSALSVSENEVKSCREALKDKFPNIIRLAMDHLKIDPNYLSSLKQLQDLELVGCSWFGSMNLANSENLKCLSISFTHPPISPVELDIDNCRALTDVSINNCILANPLNFSSCNNLERVRIVNVAPIDISSLGQCKNLIYAQITIPAEGSNKNIDLNLDPLMKLENLQELNLFRMISDDTSISLTSTVNNSSITNLTIESHQQETVEIKNIDFIKNLINLKKIKISGMKIDNIDGLSSTIEEIDMFIPKDPESSKILKNLPNLKKINSEPAKDWLDRENPMKKQ